MVLLVGVLICGRGGGRRSWREMWMMLLRMIGSVRCVAERQMRVDVKRMGGVSGGGGRR